MSQIRRFQAESISQIRHRLPCRRSAAFLADPTCSTIVDNPLQIGLFLQNKPNFPKAQMNLTSLITVDYENIANCKLCENKPNTNPIQTQFQTGHLLVNRMKPKLLNFRLKNSLTVRSNSLKYLLSYGK